MPLYRCAISEGLSTVAQRERIAKEIVRIHCDVTGAPPSFVHAFFSEAPAGALPEGKTAFVMGSIRWGRTDEQKARIVSELTGVVADVLRSGLRRGAPRSRREDGKSRKRGRRSSEERWS